MDDKLPLELEDGGFDEDEPEAKLDETKPDDEETPEDELDEDGTEDEDKLLDDALLMELDETELDE